ncbi:hypothetical protein HOY82DRAFT_562846 [Tuber indicum]|nr:hypothetical protein HOY82DRAFT_562846 [Tuber indicum]
MPVFMTIWLSGFLILCQLSWSPAEDRSWLHSKCRLLVNYTLALGSLELMPILLSLWCKSLMTA